MNSLDLYLDTILPSKPKKTLINDCCLDKENIKLSDNLLLFVCIECGTVHKDNLYHVDYYSKYKNPNYVKTFIPYSNKYRHLYRLNKWSNYSYKEVQQDKLLKEIDIKLEDFDREIRDFTKISFVKIYDKLSIRAKIKDSLIVYCIYQSSLMLKKPVEIDDLLKLFEISIKNYLDLNKKLTTDRLFYLKEMNEYLSLIDNKINKNYLIQIYNDFLTFNDRKFNNKSIVLGIIYFIISKDKDFKKKEFYELFNISKSSIKNVKKFITKNNII